eukprot:TRINITY_DN18599_c0_g1_i1.p1 TRINITY_DN18599_c0_g1~~TRINITY_DN18599_c0_g1_i1.p1  ORF type:complete len:1097 (+),score=409.16 TRINITY_DN18599_c0_g1_i1:111-3401(+)
MGRQKTVLQPCSQTDKFLRAVEDAYKGYKGSAEGRRGVLQDGVLHVPKEDVTQSTDAAKSGGVDYSVLFPLHHEKESQRRRWELAKADGAGAEEEAAYVGAAMEESKRLLIDIAAAQQHRLIRVAEELGNPSTNTTLPEVKRPPTPPTFKRAHKQQHFSSPRPGPRTRRNRGGGGGGQDPGRELPPTSPMNDQLGGDRLNSPLSRGALGRGGSSGFLGDYVPAGTHATAKSVSRQLLSHVMGSYKRVQHSKFRGAAVGAEPKPAAGTWPRQLKNLSTLSVPLVQDAGMDGELGLTLQEVDTVTEDSLASPRSAGGDRARLQAEVARHLKEGQTRESAPSFFMTEPPAGAGAATPRVPHPPRRPVEEIDGASPATATRTVGFAPRPPESRRRVPVGMADGVQLTIEAPPGSASAPGSPMLTPASRRKQSPKPSPKPSPRGKSQHLALVEAGLHEPVLPREDSFLRQQATSARALSVPELSANLRDLAAQLFVQERGYSKMVASNPTTARITTSAGNSEPRAHTARNGDTSEFTKQLTSQLAASTSSAGGRYALSYYRSAPEELHTAALADDLSRHAARHGAMSYERFKRSLDTSAARISQRCGHEIKRCLQRREIFLDTKQATLEKLAGAERLGQKNSGWQPTSKELHRAIFRLAVSREANERLKARSMFLQNASELVDSSYPYVSDCYALLDRLRELFQNDDAVFDPPTFYNIVESFPPARYLQEGLRFVVDLVRPLFMVSEEEWAVYAKDMMRTFEEGNIALLLDSAIDRSTGGPPRRGSQPSASPATSQLPPSAGTATYRRYRIRVHHVKGLEKADPNAKYFLILRSEWVHKPSPTPEVAAPAFHVPAAPAGSMLAAGSRLSRGPSGMSFSDLISEPPKEPRASGGRNAAFLGVGPPGDGGGDVLSPPSQEARASFRRDGSGSPPRPLVLQPVAAPAIDPAELRKELKTSIAVGRAAWNEEFAWCLRAAHSAVVELLLYDVTDVRQAPIGTATLYLDETLKIKPGARTRVNLPLHRERIPQEPDPQAEFNEAAQARDRPPDGLGLDPDAPVASTSAPLEIVISVSLADDNMRGLHMKKSQAQVSRRPDGAEQRA